VGLKRKIGVNAGIDAGTGDEGPKRKRGRPQKAK